MEIHTDVKKRFMSKYDRFEPVIQDHTALITAKACLRKYFLAIVLGRVTKDDAIYFAWGSSYHRFRKQLEESWGLGKQEWDEEKAKQAFVEGCNSGLKWWNEHGKDQTAESKFSFMTSLRLLQSFKVAFDHWKIEKHQNKIEVIAVEQPFNIQLSDGSFRSGRADQIVRWNGKMWGRDFKTTSRETTFYNRTLDPNEQFTGYTFAEEKLSGERVQGQLVEVLYNGKGTKTKQAGPEILSLVVNKTQWQLEEWEQDTIFWNNILNEARKNDRYPLSEVGCTFCQFHQVCKQNSEEAMMYQLESNYAVRPWDNMRDDL